MINPYVNHKVYTSAGLTSAADMLFILGALHGLLPVRWRYGLSGNNTDHQQTIYLDYQTHFNPAIHKVQDCYHSNPNKNPDR